MPKEFEILLEVELKKNTGSLGSKNHRLVIIKKDNKISVKPNISLNLRLKKRFKEWGRKEEYSGEFNCCIESLPNQNSLLITLFE